MCSQRRELLRGSGQWPTPSQEEEEWALTRFPAPSLRAPKPRHRPAVMLTTCGEDGRGHCPLLPLDSLLWVGIPKEAARASEDTSEVASSLLTGDPRTLAEGCPFQPEGLSWLPSHGLTQASTWPQGQ